MNQQNLTMIFIALLVAAALYFTLSAEPVKPPINQTVESPHEELLLTGIGFGKGETDYTYSFTRSYNGYETRYMLIKDGNESQVEIESPLSEKQVYFLENDTVLCIEFGKDRGCSSVKGDPRLDSYLGSLQAEFFNDLRIDNNLLDMSYLFDKGYVSFEGEPTLKTVNGSSCYDVAYTLDFTDITLGEAARFGIGTNAPKLFNRSMCVDNSTGYRHEETLSYAMDGMVHRHTTTLVSFEAGSAGIIAPTNLSSGAVGILSDERAEHAELNKCFTDEEGAERESCVSKVALRSKRPDLCSLSGARMDICLISIVPITRNVSICGMIGDAGYKDDCFTELAGAYKNSTYCLSILNQSKVEYCQEVSVPKNETVQNKSKIDPLDLVNYIEGN